MLEGRPYVPLLHARLAEIRAMRELPNSSKNLMVPVFRLRPWLNSKTLEKALEVIEEAVGDRLYGLDLDYSKFERRPDPTREAKVQFSALFSADEAYRAYYNLVSSGQNRVPVFRGIDSEHPQIDMQLDRVEAIDRGLFVRFSPQRTGHLLEIAQSVAQRETSNVVFIADCGWGRDLLTQAAFCARAVQQLVDISDTFEIVVAGSSFPDAFAGLGERFSIDAYERALFQEVRRQVNGGLLTYGDWGSTRPPSDPIPMRNIPRIDYSRRVRWLCWRSDGYESYSDLAKRAVNDREWDGTLGLWGEYMIQSTADQTGTEIRSPAMAAAVRVNLHLHQQAHFADPGGLHVGDELVGDDL